ncbi:bifunctional UDP-N-acetylglucosamine diphosphorylase/glucosamine-1-phosphate N-acetyltransferase GlmU [Mycoplasmatota bacterium]|nr:bifunctional UDP-N-acetylglucosamine diphosphorylase/glucosamine-1-phosphate N-acetyltransferase GlmU [Mycoplasmatota bacterium]
MEDFAIILAAGKGKRMKSNLSKVLHPVLGKPMISHVVDNLNEICIDRKILVVSEDANDIKDLLQDKVEYVVQKERLGTAHAVRMVESLIENEEGTTIVICGDTPLITSKTINALIEYHKQKNADATVLTTIVNNPNGYGRIIRDERNQLVKIVEDKDTNNVEKLIKEVNTGTYCFNNKKLFNALKKVKNNNKQGEYYLTDVIGIIKEETGKAYPFITKDVDETLGINNRVSLEKANQILKRRINEKLMENGVAIIDKENTYISIDTVIGNDTIIYPGTVCMGKNEIGSHCTIGPNTELSNSKIGNHSKIKHSVITDSVVGDNTTVGPFAHFRNHAIIGENVRIGNFVEIKNANFGDNSNAAHLAYIGDAKIGKNVNMGCGTITVNYDGKVKHQTLIEDNVFVGCNSNLIAPVTIGDNSYIAAGSTVNKDVPSDALAIGRSKLIIKEGYAKKFKK